MCVIKARKREKERKSLPVHYKCTIERCNTSNGVAYCSDCGFIFPVLCSCLSAFIHLQWKRRQKPVFLLLLIHLLCFVFLLHMRVFFFILVTAAASCNWCHIKSSLSICSIKSFLICCHFIRLLFHSELVCRCVGWLVVGEKIERFTAPSLLLSLVCYCYILFLRFTVVMSHKKIITLIKYWLPEENINFEWN